MVATIEADPRSQRSSNSLDLSDTGCDAAFALALRLSRPAAALAYAADDLLDLPVLPPVLGSEDLAHLAATGPLYLAAELEATGLVQGAETIAGLYISGGLVGDVGEAGDELHAFWKERHRRFSVEERTAIYTRLFGGVEGPRLAVRGATNEAFESLMIEFTDAVYSSDPLSSGRSSAGTAVAISASGLALADNLSQRHGGVPDVAAAELIGSVQRALEMFKQPALQLAVGARSVWAAVAAVSRRYLAVDAHVAQHVSRGKSGLVLLAWLAEAVPSMGVGSRLPPIPDQLIAAAGEWLRSTLNLHDALAAASRPPARAGR